jgi:hypothetical protein
MPDHAFAVRQNNHLKSFIVFRRVITRNIFDRVRIRLAVSMRIHPYVT